jgi:hypothetical protein
MGPTKKLRATRFSGILKTGSIDKDKGLFITVLYKKQEGALMP